MTDDQLADELLHFLQRIVEGRYTTSERATAWGLIGAIRHNVPITRDFLPLTTALVGRIADNKYPELPGDTNAATWWLNQINVVNVGPGNIVKT